MVVTFGEKKYSLAFTTKTLRSGFGTLGLTKIQLMCTTETSSNVTLSFSQVIFLFFIKKMYKTSHVNLLLQMI